MTKKRPTAVEILAQKGKRQMTMLFLRELEEARAADQAGIDMLSVSTTKWSPEFRNAAGNCFVQIGLHEPGVFTEDDFVRAGYQAMEAQADCVYCVASLKIIETLSKNGIPVVAHSGVIPQKITWSGYRAVGKTASSAMMVYEQMKSLENAGAIAAELEIVPDRVTEEITKRTKMLVMSMGSGPKGDVQYLYAADILGYTEGRVPRHSKIYRDFRTKLDELQNERVTAFGEYISDVQDGSFPEQGHIVGIADDEFEAFQSQLPSREPESPNFGPY